MDGMVGFECRLSASLHAGWHRMGGIRPGPLTLGSIGCLIDRLLQNDDRTPQQLRTGLAQITPVGVNIVRDSVPDVAKLRLVPQLLAGIVYAEHPSIADLEQVVS